MDFTSLVVLIAITSGLVQAIKKTEVFNTKWIPLTSVLMGVVVVGVSGFFSFTNLTLLQGLVVGLAATGLFENITKPVEK
jgi:hypothetical protein